MIVPAIVSSTFLSMGTTIILVTLTVFLFVLTKFHHPFPGLHDNSYIFPDLYLIGFILSIMIGLLFLSYFGIRFSGESKGDQMQ